MQIEQIAVVADREFSQQNIFGYNDWSTDIVTAKGILYDGIHHKYIKVENAAKLRFSYCVVPGKEFELIHYIDGPNFLYLISPGQLSHLGLHVNSIDAYQGSMANRGFQLIQEVVTQSHTSINVLGNRRYHYAIYRHNSLGFHWKLIERIDSRNADEELEKVYDFL